AVAVRKGASGKEYALGLVAAAGTRCGEESIPSATNRMYFFANNRSTLFLSECKLSGEQLPWSHQSCRIRLKYGGVGSWKSKEWEAPCERGVIQRVVADAQLSLHIVKCPESLVEVLRNDE